MHIFILFTMIIIDNYVTRIQNKYDEIELCCCYELSYQYDIFW